MPTLSCPSLRILGSLAALALLQACASQPQLSAHGEASRYRTHARRSYAPPGPPSDPWGPHIREAAAKYDVPESWVRAVMHQESGGHLFQRGELITSGAGAMGLMQVMPGTYDELRGRYPELGDDPFDPHDNIMAGTAYLREMYDIYGSPGFLAAYNAGPGRLDDYLTRNRTLPAETRRYVAAISPHLGGGGPRRASPGAQYAMNALPAAIPAGPRYPAESYAAPVAYAQFRPAPEPLPPAAVPEPAPAPVALAMNTVALLPPPAPAPAPLPVPPPMPVALPSAPMPPPRPVYAPPEPPMPVQVAELPDEMLPDPDPEPRDAAPRRAARPRMQAERSPREVLRSPPVRLASREVLPLPPALPANMPFQMASASQHTAPGGRGFHLITPAMAEPVAPHRGGSGAANWGIQVGAFATSNMATAATAAARDEARGDLGRAHGSVTEVRQGRGKLYRARLQGISRDGAAHACERLAHQRTSCMVVSPDAQS